MLLAASRSCALSDASAASVISAAVSGLTESQYDAMVKAVCPLVTATTTAQPQGVDAKEAERIKCLEAENVALVDATLALNRKVEQLEQQLENQRGHGEGKKALQKALQRVEVLEGEIEPLRVFEQVT